MPTASLSSRSSSLSLSTTAQTAATEHKSIKSVFASWKEALAQHWEEFRLEHPTASLQAFLVFLYAGIVVATVLLAPPPVMPVEVKTGTTSFGLVQKPYIDVYNKHFEQNEAIVVEVTGRLPPYEKSKAMTWRAVGEMAAPGASVRLWPEQFIDESGTPANHRLQIDSVRLYRANNGRKSGRAVVDGSFISFSK